MAQGLLIVNFQERFPTDKVFQGETADLPFTRSLETFVSKSIQQIEFENCDKNTRGRPGDEGDKHMTEEDEHVTGHENATERVGGNESLGGSSLEKEGLRRNPSAETDISNEISEHQLTVTSLTEKPLIDFSRSKAQGILQKLVNIFSKEDEEKKKERRQKRKAEIEGLRRRFRPPDGGYGWLVVFGTFLVQLWITGLIKSFGIIFLEVMTVFPNSSASLAAWIPAILTFISLVLSPVTSALCLRFSCRTVVFAGGLCSCLGLTLSSFATSLEHLCFTIGVLVGVGAGLATTPGILMTSRYFENRRALANGICISGTAVGSMVMPLLVEFLSPRYGFRGTIMILGACMLHVCVAALLFRPVEVYQKILENDAKAKESVERKEEKVVNEKEVVEHNVADAIMKSGRFSISLHTQDVSALSPEQKLDDRLPEANFSLDDSDDEDARSLVHDTITPLVNSRLLRSVRNESTPALRAGLPGNSPVVGAQLTRHASLQRDGRFFFGKLGSLKDVTSLRNFDDEAMTQNVTPARRRNVSWLQSTNSLVHSVVDLNVDSTCTFKDQISKSEPSEEEKKKKGLQRYVNFGLLKNTLFVLLTSTVMLMAVGCPHVLLYLPAYVTTSMGLTKSESGVLLSITAACDLVGRLVGGWLADMQFISRGRMYSCSMMLAAITAISLPFAKDMVSLGILSGMFGVGSGSWFLMVPILLTDYHGVDIIPSSYGLVRLFQGIVTLGIPPLIGLLRDLTGTYQTGFFVMGGCMSCASICMLIFEPLAKKIEEKKKTLPTEETEAP